MKKLLLGILPLALTALLPAQVQVTSTGLGLGTTTPVYKLDVIGTLAVRTSASAGGQVLAFLASSAGGTLYVNSNFDPANPGVNWVAPMFWSTAGDVGIGTSTPTHKLQVVGSVRATSFISNSTTYADFVFKPDYRLPPLAEVEMAIKAKGHLPGIPSEAEAKANGIDLAAMQVKLLQKVEELTLYVIDLKKENTTQSESLTKLQQENTELRRDLGALKTGR